MSEIAILAGALAVLALGVFLGFSLADYVRERMVYEAWTPGPNPFNFQNFRDVVSLPRGVRIHRCPPTSADDHDERAPHFALSPESERFLHGIEAEDERAERAMG